MSVMRLTDYTEHVHSIKAKSTAEMYSSSVAKFLRHLGQNPFTVTSMPVNTLQKYISFLSQTLKATSVNVHWAAIKHYLNWLKENGVIVARTAKPELPRIGNPKRIFFDLEQLIYIIKFVDENIADPAKTLLTILAGSGLRVSEVCSIKIGDISISESGRIMLSVVGKRQKQRNVPLLSFAKIALISYLRKQTQDNGPDDFLFPSDHADGHVNIKRVQKWTERLSAKIGFHIHPHALRRTHFTLLNNQGVDPFTIKEIAGHSNLATTSLYVKVDAGKMDDSLKSLEAEYGRRKQ